MTTIDDLLAHNLAYADASAPDHIDVHPRKRLAIVTPGFAADCLETIEEIGVENAGYFRLGGGENFAAIPCLNDSAEGVRVIQNVVQRELSGWL